MNVECFGLWSCCVASMLQVQWVILIRSILRVPITGYFATPSRRPRLVARRRQISNSTDGRMIWAVLQLHSRSLSGTTRRYGGNNAVLVSRTTNELVPSARFLLTRGRKAWYPRKRLFINCRNYHVKQIDQRQIRSSALKKSVSTTDTYIGECMVGKLWLKGTPQDLYHRHIYFIRLVYDE